MEDDPDWLAPCDWLSLLSSTSGAHLPTVTPLTVGWALPYQTPIKKMPYRVIYSSLLSHFLSQVSPFPDELSLCQLDHKQTKTKKYKTKLTSTDYLV